MAPIYPNACRRSAACFYRRSVITSYSIHYTKLYENTDMKFEQENIARLMRMAVNYGRSIGFKGDFYIEPKPKVV